VVTVSPGFTSKLVARVSRFGSQNRQLRFGDLSLKIIVTDSCFGPQNQAGFGVPVAPQNRQREDNVGHTSRSSDLLHLKASRDRIFQSGLKTNGGATAGGARGTIAEVRRDQVEDG
jgi:hypothetical protein